MFHMSVRYLPHMCHMSAVLSADDLLQRAHFLGTALVQAPAGGSHPWRNARDI